MKNVYFTGIILSLFLIGKYNTLTYSIFGIFVYIRNLKFLLYLVGNDISSLHTFMYYKSFIKMKLYLII